MREIEIRPAGTNDCTEIARLFLISSDGLAEYIWSRFAEPGETAEQAGARRYARVGVPFSFENCSMATDGQRVVGMVHSFPMDLDPDSVPESDPVLRPYSELEDYGSLYVSGIAVHEDWRNRGIGRILMQATKARARQLMRPRLSLICIDRNQSAMRFYKRLGFRELARRAIIPHKTFHYSEGDAVLLAWAVE
jgi:ribosomal protein S18 acetylase RimI-like enzyme